MSKHGQSTQLAADDWAASLRTAAVYSTKLGVSVIDHSDKLLAGPAGAALHGKVQLVFTSPPFPLNREKAYKNKQGGAYVKWLRQFAPLVRDILTADGSIVIEVGNAWETGLPVMSTLALESLLAFKEYGRFYLCQEFIWHNPAKLPTPAQWVTVKRVRVKDAFTRLWWLSATPHPYADNTQVLQPYSKSMLNLLRRKSYNSGRRPSEHDIGQRSFLTDNGGAIPPNVIRADEPDIDNVLTVSNTSSSDSYLLHCREVGIPPHPARMPVALAEFFVRLCTRPGDLVLDPFAGSNTTGAAAQALGRRWISVEARKEYASAGMGRFIPYGELVKRELVAAR